MDRVRADRVVLRDGDTGPAAALGARVDVEDGDPVCRGRVTPGRPDGVLHRVGRGAGVNARRGRRGGPGGPGEHLGLGVGGPGGTTPREGTAVGAGHVPIRVGVGAAAAEDEVHRAQAGVEHPAVRRRHRVRPQGVDHRAGRDLAADVSVGAAHRERPFVGVIMAGEHQVHLVPVEQRQPLLANAQVGAVSVRGRRRALVHLDDDPVDRPVAAPVREGPLEPRGLAAAGVAPQVERRARFDRRMTCARRRGQRGGPRDERARVLVDDVVGVQRDEQDRADPKGIPPAAEARHPVIRQRVASQVRGESLRPVAELHLVVTRARHPRPVRGRGLIVAAEVTPDAGLAGGVQVRVAQIAVQQVEQRLEGLHGLDRVGALAVGEHPVGVGRGQVAEAGETERSPAPGRGPEDGAERIRGVAVVVGGDQVRVGRAGPQPADPGVIGPDRLAVDPVGIRARLGRDDPLPDPHLRPDRRAGRRPRDDDTGCRALAPGEMDLLGGAGGPSGLARPRGHRGRPGRGREQAGAARAGEHLAARHR
jgi:hypothetical protein